MTVNTSLPVDTTKMRATTARLLANDAGPLSPGELDTLTLTLKGYMQLLIPEVERAAAQPPDDDPTMTIPVACAVVAAAEARRKLDIPLRPGASAASAYARRLARSVECLLTSLESLGAAQP
ncbi:DUF6415 family natural product biosynthesis protein [Streptomyces sp. NBC_00878]|uniref:DUF6415 family natural product biosynthesis protein n=1 Tax=Streptomyces sp. NBC_00878 TaxID=2975854 RepID=UPI00225B2330|nr:DUF6415 family natural product biosynthesis protein [Streptomyces sp. NBC_00878]MCX4905811.1 DUF6415 family natural product biosynthesis protein [Streptomyces sp. NBC_00878]